MGKAKKNYQLWIYYIVLLIYFFGGIGAIFASRIFGLNQEVMGVAFLCGAILSLILSRIFQPLQISNYLRKEDFSSSSRVLKFSLIVFIYLALLSVYIFLNSQQNYSLPPTFFLVICSMVVVIAIQILTHRQLSTGRIYIILTEIIILSTILTASFTFLFPGGYGNDSSFHTDYISGILSSGHIYERQGGDPGQYVVYPLYHIFYAEIMTILNLGVKIASFILGVVQILFLLFIFLICRKLFNVQSALLSTLFISTAPHLFVPKYSFYPGAFSAIFFILLLYLFLTIATKPSRPLFILLIIALVAATFFHPLVGFILSVTVLLMFIAQNTLRLSDLKIPISFVILSFVLTLSQWMRPTGGESTLTGFVQTVQFAFIEESSTTVTQATSSPFYSLLDITLIQLGFATLILLGIAAALLFLRRNITSIKEAKTDVENKQTALALATLALIPIPYVLAIIVPNALPDRWFIFIEVLVGIFAGVTLFLIFYKLRNSKFRYTVHILLVITIFFSITSPLANPNSKIYAEALAGRSGLTQSEIDAARFVDTFSDRQKLHGSSYYLAFIGNIKSPLEKLINPNVKESYQNGTIIIRNEDFRRGFPVSFYGQKGLLTEIVLPSSDFYAYLNTTNKLYDNGEVRIYLNNATGT